LNKDVINEYWLMALVDFDDGISIKEMEKTLKLYEREEMYEACAGILKAIKQIKNERKDKKISRS
tara:strand:+ start:1509 stop:1703 length:195 start_codon:yes stop_codon:yes gene_type:complete